MEEKIDMAIKQDSLLVSGDKCFFSLQGEGDSIGRPAIFLRLHLCNLQCSFCDTPYTWDRKDKRFFTEPERWSIKETVKKIEKYPCSRLVITGGEPLLQKGALIKLIDLLFPNHTTSAYLRDWKIEIETNGTLPPLRFEKQLRRDIQYNVSPKLENSGNLKILRYSPGVLKRFNSLSLATFKFVVTCNKDLEEIEKIVKECGLDKDKIILMPEGIKQEDVARHGRAVAELCKEKGWRLIPRLHILLWGNKRDK